MLLVKVDPDDFVARVLRLIGIDERFSGRHTVGDLVVMRVGGNIEQLSHVGFHSSW
ncbi:hypothetical protein D3C72_2532630 [compost metagenome]